MPSNSSAGTSAVQTFTITTSSLLADFSGASAAYSLRDLAGNDPNVVRVRRDSDDAEQDFTASDVADGTLLNYVVPTDVQALYNNAMFFNDEGRVNISNIVMNSDFFVEQRLIINSFTGTNARFHESSGGLQYPQFIDANTFRLRVGAANHDIVLDAPIPIGQEFTFRYMRTGSILSVEVDGILQSNTVTVSTATYPILYIGGFNRLVGSIYDININNQAAYNGSGITLADWEDQIGSNDGTPSGSFELFTGQGFNGFVRTWYDQAGTNHATQTTPANQPQIVSNGSVILENGLCAEHHLCRAYLMAVLFTVFLYGEI